MDKPLDKNKASVGNLPLWKDVKFVCMVGTRANCMNAKGFDNNSNSNNSLFL